jgi:HSP20 family protein
MMTPWLDLWDDDLLPNLRDSTLSGVDVYETETEVVVKVNIAGVPEEKIDLTFERGVLYVNAVKDSEEKDDKRNYYSRSSKQYAYRVSVPGELDLTREPDASVGNGILTVTFAKSKQAMPRKLQIKSKK